MAVVALALGYNPSKGVDYTYTTDTSADFVNVPTDTYFYNLEDKLPYYMDLTDTVISLFEGGAGGDGIYGGSGDIPDQLGGIIATQLGIEGLVYKGFDVLNSSLNVSFENSTGDSKVQITNQGSLLITTENLGSPFFNIDVDTAGVISNKFAFSRSDFTASLEGGDFNFDFDPGGGMKIVEAGTITNRNSLGTVVNLFQPSNGSASYFGNDIGLIVGGNAGVGNAKLDVIGVWAGLNAKFGGDTLTTGDCDAVTYSVNGVSGANFTGVVTNITVVDGLVTAVS